MAISVLYTNEQIKAFAWRCIYSQNCCHKNYLMHQVTNDTYWDPIFQTDHFFVSHSTKETKSIKIRCHNFFFRWMKNFTDIQWPSQDDRVFFFFWGEGGRWGWGVLGLFQGTNNDTIIFFGFYIDIFWKVSGLVGPLPAPLSLHRWWNPKFGEHIWHYMGYKGNRQNSTLSRLYIYIYKRPSM